MPIMATNRSFSEVRGLQGWGCRFDQWRYYLDIFGLDVFRWQVFMIQETEPNEYAVTDFMNSRQDDTRDA